MRVASVNEQVTPVGGPYGHSPTATTITPGRRSILPGYLQTDTVVHVVSNLYSLDQTQS